jgi:hypothetical protein
MDTSDFVAPHTSPILRDYSSNGCIVDEKSNYSQTMLNWFTDNGEMKDLYSDPRYCILVERLKKLRLIFNLCPTARGVLSISHRIDTVTFHPK